MWVTSSCTAALTPTAVALGNFDGLHLGHRQVIEPILNPSWVNASKASWEKGISATLGHKETLIQGEMDELSRREMILGSRVLPTEDYQREEIGPGAKKSVCPTVVTFNPHPQEFFTGQPRKLLTPLTEKIELLREMGVKQLLLLPFDRDLAALTPVAFVEEILVRQLHVHSVSVGWDFRFGQGRTGTATDLQEMVAGYGIEVTAVPVCSRGKERISSSAIRQYLAEGALGPVNQLLGRAYRLTGVVVQGQQLGRTLGFPTANLQLPPEKFLPRFGVYAVRVWVKQEVQQITMTEALQAGVNVLGAGNPALPYPVFGVMNIGCRPTVAGESPTVEVHLLDWGEDLYGKTLTVSLEQFLRPEQKFPSLEALKAQIQADCERAREFLTANS